MLRLGLSNWPGEVLKSFLNNRNLVFFVKICENLICPLSSLFLRDKQYVYSPPPKENCLRNVV